MFSDGPDWLSGCNQLDLLALVELAVSTDTATAPFILLFRGTDWDRGLSPEELQHTLSRWTVWFDRLTADGKAKLGQPLAILLRVTNLDEATEIAKECPGLDCGMSVEIRPISEDMGRGPV